LKLKTRAGEVGELLIAKKKIIRNADRDEISEYRGANSVVM
jgi:hypothetical protein